MSLVETLKGFVLKKPATPRPASTEPQTDNPYLNARRAWNEHTGSVVSQKQTWQMVGILSLMIVLAAVGGVIHIGSQSKFVPFIYEVDKLGQTRAIGPMTQASKVSANIVQAAVTDFVNDARLVTPDVALQRKAVYRIYSKLGPNDPATAKMNEWLNGKAEASPFARAAVETVSTEIVSAIPQTPDTWQVDWIETTRDRQGVIKGQPVRMRVLATVYIVEPNENTDEAQVRNNPAGVYIRDFSWSRLL
ncbi:MULTISPECIES: conjugal transfer protein TrbF [Xanthomonas]|uniref:Conjugal transfer protein TrbF n=1 Tax=Xanthomonas hortorum pv. vitians TaxID=83224 RepID=A0AAW8ZS72_9XANT|nr:MULTISPECIES: conjugal transfer protein TrbF [Xanthomonas]CAD7741911.1 conjugal transfer protein TrbF [Xanthomonas hydrangeae]KGP23809.1 conjugal transfer protein TrbF [Xanthomonas citri pv. fuscans]KGT57558.1 conjugal transfer protein TrbF [Xanthomonas citri pv. fuscans]MDV7248944.1 conjugal transfer protein TrbF [Xanthomonas hortorum pv. vitians]CAD7741915.1 conjugal transfer protein TrbF [Xanthomonas hydrangeae]